MRWIALVLLAVTLPGAEWVAGPPIRLSGTRTVSAALALADGGAFALSRDPSDAAAPDQAWRLDASRSSWRSLGAAPAHGMSATSLGSGTILLAGGGDGWAGAKSAAAVTYDPVSDAWAPAAALGMARSGEALLPLAGGGALALAYGGLHDLDPTAMSPEYEMYLTPSERLVAGAWQRVDAPPMLTSVHAQGVTLADGSGLIVGGEPSPNSGSAESGPDVLVSPDGAVLSEVPWPGFDRPEGLLLSSALAALGDGGAILVGGVPNGAPYDGTAIVSIFERTTRTWADGPSSHLVHSGRVATRLRDGRILVGIGLAAEMGGGPGGMEVFDPQSLEWSPVLAPEAAALLITLADGTVLALGGYGSTSLLAIPSAAGPSVSFSSEVAYVSRAEPLHAHLHFSSAVSGLAPAAFVTDNVSSLSLAGAGADYDLAISGAADGALRVSLPAGAVSDGAGRGNPATTLVRLVDRQAPTVSLGEPLLADGQVSWLLHVQGADRLDLGATPFQARFTGTLTGRLGWSSSDLTLYDISGRGQVSIAIAAGIAADAAGNRSAASGWSSACAVDTAPSSPGDGGGDGGAGSTPPVSVASASTSAPAGQRCGLGGATLAAALACALVRRRRTLP